MIGDIRKTWAILSAPEKRKASGMLVLIALMAAAEMLGVLSVMPFLSTLGRPEVIHENPVLEAVYTRFSFGAERNLQKPCPGFPPAANAAAMAAMLDRVQLPAGDRSVWRLRFQAARLYWTAGQPEAALREGRQALQARTAEAPVALFVAGMLLQQGDRAGAAQALRAARARVRPGDGTGMRLLSRYEAELAASGQ